MMTNVKIDYSRILGKIKPMHAVNNGPLRGTRIFPNSGNMEDFTAAHIPFVRNHDAAFCANYGGEHTVDIHAIFPDFERDVDDPASYDFICTDDYTAAILEAGSEVFYRLGNKIDHRVKKYDSVPPSDYLKWAKICEHIILHYNEGWADGFHYGIRYWEIWNEPENTPECWLGTFEEYEEFYVLVSKYLKSKFPDLKIGGPALTTGGVERRRDTFLAYVKEHGAPLDFFSWHTYKNDTENYRRRIVGVRESLDAAGFTETESILNEWNYVINWKDGIVQSKKTIISIKGAAFTSAIMATGQNNPLDMLMYYDARPCALNGLFDFYTNEKLKGYYPFPMFATLYALGKHAETETDADDIYAVAATDGEKKALMLTYFTNDEAAEPRDICLNVSGAKDADATLARLDSTHDAEPIENLCLSAGKATLRMEPNSVILLEF